MKKKDNEAGLKSAEDFGFDGLLKDGTKLRNQDEPSTVSSIEKTMKLSNKELVYQLV